MSDDSQAIARGHRAERELELTRSAFERLKTAAIEEWTSTAMDQVAKREKLFIVVSTLDAVRTALLQVADDGKMASARQALAEANLIRP
jgi:hypothetical protein